MALVFSISRLQNLRVNHLLFWPLALAISTLAAADKKGPLFDDKLKPFVDSFRPGGALTDASKPLTPEATIKNFKIGTGLAMQVVAHEPLVRQPLNINFDERGRLWVVQYLQYPFPAGLKIVSYDKYLRAVYDKMPKAPPHHDRGADLISIHEDTDGDGRFDKHKVFVDGLNMARSVLSGRGGVWVLMPPYLLFYPDKNRDDVPDGPPEVHLSGFGLEDTHSGANSLRWGPDGWIYGAHGSTCTADIQGVKFLGQAVWRYHPATKKFEVFAEGGGNTYCIDFDSQGRLFSGTNYGDTRGVHYEQGGCYIKGWGKHGPLMNPYAFGWFEHMAQVGFKPRFPQSMIVYEGGALPNHEGQIIAAMSLVNRVQASRIYADTSTFRTEDTDTPVLTDDRWFRPVDTKAGPDGAVYFADWYDSRLSHLDPRDTWHKESGRIYRLQNADAPKLIKPFDLAKSTGVELIAQLRNPNKWWRQESLRVLADRRDAALLPALKNLVAQEQGQLALEAFWAVNVSGGFDTAFAAQTLRHTNPFVRYWTIRLLGDNRQLASDLRPQMLVLARSESNPEVRSQLAASCKRWPADAALPLLRELLARDEDGGDKHIPLLLWWAIENKAVSDRAQVIALFKDAGFWSRPIVRTHIIARLGRRYTAERTTDNLQTAAALMQLAPGDAQLDLLITGMEEGLRGDTVRAVPETLLTAARKAWQTRPHTPTLTSFATRLGLPEALQSALDRVADAKTTANDRRELIRLLAERREPRAVPVFLRQFRDEKSDAPRNDLLAALQRFDDIEIGRTILDQYTAMTSTQRVAAQHVMASRSNWSLQLLQSVGSGVARETIDPATLLAMQSHRDKSVDQLIQKHWGRIRQTTEAKTQRMAEVKQTLASGKGSAVAGRELFKLACATCHRFQNEGGNVGPDLGAYQLNNLDFLIPAIVDPSLGIREEFAGFNITTRDDQTLTGFITQQTPLSVTLRDLARNEVTLARSEVKSLQAMSTSLMPEGLLDALQPQQVRDLFAYLLQTK